MGIWKALWMAGINATCNAGTSAGAIMAAFNSHGYSVQGAERLIRGLSDDDIRAERFLWKLRIPWIKSFMLAEPVQEILEEYLPRDFSQLQKDCFVFATDMKTGKPWQFGMRGDLIQAILASMAIPGVFPPVGDLCDGGNSADIPLPYNWQDFDEIYLLIAKRPLNYSRIDSMLSRLFYNADLYLEDQISDTIALAKSLAGDRVKVIRPAISSYTGMLRFNHQLIDDAYVASSTIINGWSKGVEEKFTSADERKLAWWGKKHDA